MDLTQLPDVNAPLPWHQTAWSALVRQVEQDRLPHAVLLAGESGVGVPQLALALARLLLCEAPRDGLNCGECQACRLSGSGAHGDFLWVTPEQKSRTIKIDQVRGAVEFMTKTSAYGARKVVVFAPAEAMNTNAFNALLKSLEEPAPETFLVLACHALHNVPPTIRSRCQLRQLTTPSSKAAAQWLTPRVGGGARCEELLAIAGGRPLLAQQLHEDDNADAVRARRAALDALTQGRLASTEAAPLWNDVDADAMLEEFTTYTRQALRTMPLDSLRQQGRAAFELLDELGRLQRAVSAGSNPGRGILADAVLAKFHTVLGGAI
jgi:DNA polymerase-3 subunit delta'